MKAFEEENTPISTEVLLQNGFTSIITKDFKSKDIDLFRSLIYLIGRNPYERNVFTERKIRELADFSPRNYDPKTFDIYITEVLKKIAQSIFISDNEKKLQVLPLFSYLEYDYEERCLTAEANINLINYLDIKKKRKEFFALNISVNNQLKNKYAKLLLPQLERWQSIGKLTLSVQKLKELMSVDEDYVNKKFMQKIIIPAVNELKPHFKNLKVEKLKDGRTISRLKFTFTPIQRISDQKQRQLGAPNTINDAIFNFIDQI